MFTLFLFVLKGVINFTPFFCYIFVFINFFVYICIVLIKTDRNYGTYT